MRVLHNLGVESTEAYRNLMTLVERRRMVPPDEAAATQREFELELRDCMAALEREIVTVDIKRLDVNAPAIEVDGVRYRRRKDKTIGRYTALCGELQIERTVYERCGVGGGETIAPIELRLGLINGHWTPLAAEVGCSFVTATTPGESSDLLRRVGGMKPSPSHLDRLPKIVSTVWEANRTRFEAAVRRADALPDPTVVATIVGSLDGVHVPMKTAPKQPAMPKRPQRPGADSKRATGYKEAGCGTLTLYDARGARLHTIRLGRMPQKNKVDLHAQLERELAALVELYPEADVRWVADGAVENWRIVEEIEDSLGRPIEQMIDFFHAWEHLAEGLRAHAEDRPHALRSDLAYWRTQLREERGGVDKCIRALAYRHNQARGKKKKRLRVELGYLRRHRHMMNYARYTADHQPIGSGIQEAACKTLVTQRLKRSGMTWSPAGGQAILTMRAWQQSNRWDHAWEVLLPQFVTPFKIVTKPIRRRLEKAA